MGALARILRIAWARWGDYNSFVAILVLLDWKTGFFGLISGLLMMFFGADVWTVQGAVLAGLAAAAFVSIIAIAVRIFAFEPPSGDQAHFRGKVVDREGSNDERRRE
jgi:hypothetical protein